MDLLRDRLGRTAIRSAQVLIVLALVVVVGYVGVRLRLVVVPLLIATLVAAALSPVVSWLTRRGLPRLVGVWTALLGLIGLLAAAGWLVGRAVRNQWDELRESAGQGLVELQDLVIERFGIDESQIEAARAGLGEALSGSQLQTGAVSGAVAVVEVIVGIFLGIVVLYFLLADGPRIWEFLRDLLPARHHASLDAVADRSVGVLGGYVRGTAIIAFVDAVVIGVALVVLGVPLALPLAVVVFVGAFVPLVGATVAGGLAALVALVANGPVTALIVVAVVVAVNQLEGDLLAPVVLGRSLKLHPLAVLLALSAGTIVAGIVGAILAVPFAAVTWAAFTTVRDRREERAPSRLRAP